MRNIYFVQACDVHGSGENASAYLPYATGLLAAYAFRNETVKQNYEVRRFIYRKEKIAEAIDSMEAPAIVGFSTYIWNFEYNLAFAKELKKRYPGCVTVFGGHHVYNNSARQLEEYPFIDFLIHGEGEEAFCGILLKLIGDGDFSGIGNISYRDADGNIIKNPAKEICTVDFPSPYLDGWFDDILKNDKIIFSALLETNRGCPFHCAYCDWGSVKLRMRQFPIERVIAEMQWFADHKIQFCFCIDSNFGMFKRDFEIVDAFLDIKAKTGYPEVFKCCTTEGSGLAEFNINKKLNDCGILKGASLALQTLSDTALTNIGRKNMSLKRYSELSAKYNEENIPTYSELIYGLPGETYESFADNLSFMLESGTTKGCFIHFCELLPNASLAMPENIEKFGIKTARIPYTQFHAPLSTEVQEFSNVIISTYSMDYDMWVDACIFGLFVQCFHYMGILQFFAKYLFYEKKLSYRTIYEKLIIWAKNKPETLLGEYLLLMINKLSAEKRGETISRSFFDPQFGDIDWPMEEGMALRIISDTERFFNEIRSFTTSFGIPQDICEELLRYQMLALRKPEDGETEADFSYDFHRFFRNIDLMNYSPLQKKKNTVFFRNGIETKDLADYAMRIVWFGRKSAKLMYSENEIEQEIR
ncbi:MAG: cobalamin-dependent protein [Clostridia bacterium]|nr:cobalamin-dependent protein [Clostridia bacterium]